MAGPEAELLYLLRPGRWGSWEMPSASCLPAVPAQGGGRALPYAGCPLQPRQAGQEHSEGGFPSSLGMRKRT